MRFDPARLGGLPSTMDEDRFVDCFGGIYEHSPWVARETWRRGLEPAHDHVGHLAAAMAAVVDEANLDTRVALIRAHPDLAGRASVAGELSADSTREQSGAGINQCTTAEFERFQYLNESYKRQFGFPFVMAVKGSDRHAILAAFEERLRHSPEVEFERAMAEIHRIARFRLETLSEDAGAED